MMVVTKGQQYNIGEKSTFILYTYINRHAETQNTISPLIDRTTDLLYYKTVNR